MEIKKPIFIIGAGRSGTSLLYSILALHPEVCWFSNLTDRYPKISILPLFHRVMFVPFLSNIMQYRIIKAKRPSLKPSEAGTIYHSYLGFENTKKMTEDELTEDMERNLKKIIRNHLKFTGKQRFLNKQTANTQRIQVINKMFPDAYFIHIIRDGRAVANSCLNVSWWNEIVLWWFGDKPYKWQEMGKEPIELCGLHWKRDVEELLQNKYLFKNRYLEVKYEDLIRDPINNLNLILGFCELDNSSKLEQLLTENVKNMNHKWKTLLTASQKKILEKSIGNTLLRLGYPL